MRASETALASRPGLSGRTRRPRFTLGSSWSMGARLACIALASGEPLDAPGTWRAGRAAVPFRGFVDSIFDRAACLGVEDIPDDQAGSSLRSPPVLRRVGGRIGRPTGEPDGDHPLLRFKTNEVGGGGPVAGTTGHVSQGRGCDPAFAAAAPLVG